MWKAVSVDGKASASLNPSATRSSMTAAASFHRPTANRGRMSYERSDDEAVIGSYSILSQAPRRFSLSLRSEARAPPDLHGSCRLLQQSRAGVTHECLGVS